MTKILFFSFLCLFLLVSFVNSQETSPESSEAIPENLDPAPTPETKETEPPISENKDSPTPENPQNTANDAQTQDESINTKTEDNPISNEQPQENQAEEALPEIQYQEPETIPLHNVDPIDENKRPGPSDEFIMEWEKVMGNFIPEDITTFRIEEKSTEVRKF